MRIRWGTAVVIVGCVVLWCVAAPVGAQDPEAHIQPVDPTDPTEPIESIEPGESSELAESHQELEETSEEPEPWLPIEMLGASVEPGRTARLVLRSSEGFAGGHIETPVVVMHGTMRGPRLCLVAGVHGDEVNGVEIIRRVLQNDGNSMQLQGTLVAVPIANLSAFRRGSRYLPDRRDLNRYFPGRIDGSSASRIAYRLFHNVIRHCDAVVDIHTGSFHRTNLHQVRADLVDEDTADLAKAYGAEVIVNNPGRPGTLRRAANDVGIPAITIEAGEPARFNEQIVKEATVAISRLIYNLGMSNESPSWLERTKTAVAYWSTRWVRCNTGGVLVSNVQLGDTVEKGALLGVVSDPISDEVDKIRAPFDGRIIGMALDQLVMPGFAAYHLAMDEAHTEETPADLYGESVEEPEGVDLEERPE